MISRNKTIKILHDVTGEPYKVCRAKLKANNWDLLRVVYPPDFMKALDSLKEYFTKLGEALRVSLQSLSELKLDNLKEALLEASEEANNE